MCWAANFEMTSAAGADATVYWDVNRQWAPPAEWDWGWDFCLDLKSNSRHQIHVRKYRTVQMIVFTYTEGEKVDNIQFAAS